MVITEVIAVSVKRRVLEILNRDRGSYISGEQIARELSITRSAVWKAIRTLREEGCAIEATTRRGYMLHETADVLTPEAVKERLRGAAKNLRLKKLETANSTNVFLRECALNGEAEGLVVLSDEQTEGRGRRGRSFHSPAGAGLYMSVLLRPTCSLEESLFLTTAAASAVALSIEKISGQSAQIKWVNDVLIKGKKVCGILTEAAIAMETGGLEFAIVGIGVNVRQPEGGYPEDIRETAAAIFTKNPAGGVRSRLAAEILNRFMNYYRSLERKTFLNDYKRRSVVIGKDVTVIGGGEEKRAHVLDIDENCRLLVVYEDGSEGTLSSGEISIKI